MVLREITIMTKFELQQTVSELYTAGIIIALYSSDEEQQYLHILRQNCPSNTTFFVTDITRKTSQRALLPKYLLISESNEIPLELADRCKAHNTTILRWSNV